MRVEFLGSRGTVLRTGWMFVDTPSLEGCCGITTVARQLPKAFHNLGARRSSPATRALTVENRSCPTIVELRYSKTEIRTEVSGERRRSAPN
jgi:hypothetical protein